MTKNNSYIIPSREILPIYRTCCPYDTKNFIHPRLNLTSSTNQMKIKNIDTCCLNKLQVDCRIQCHKKKKTYDCQRKTDSIQSFPNTKRTISLLSSSRKQRKFDSNTNVNSYNYDLNTTTSEQTFSSIESKRQYIYETKSANIQNQLNLHLNQHIQDLKNSIDHLSQLIVQQQKDRSQTMTFIDKFRQFVNRFKS